MLRSTIRFPASSSSKSTSALVEISSIVSSLRFFRDNFAKQPPRLSKEKTRRDQLDNIFKTKQKHASEQKRVLSMESEVREKPQFQIQKQFTSRPAVSLLELDQQQDELFSPSQQQEDEDNLVLANSNEKGELVAPGQVEGDVDGENVTSVLVDDSFGYLPQLAAQSEVVPGQALVPPGLTRMKLDIQFRGDHFYGWDRQAQLLQKLKQENNKNSNANENDLLSSATLARSVKNALEEALVVALDLSELPNKNSKQGGGIVPSCILETGIHARRLTCHIDIPSDLVMQPRTVLQRAHIWLNKCNDPLGILSFTPAPAGFHAQHSTRRRVFVYRMLNRIAPPLFDVGTQWHVDRALDIDRMNEACKMLQGTQDYTAFADAKVVPALRQFKGSGIRTIDRLQVTRQDDEVLIWFVGKSFLRHQVRNMVSVLRLVGQGLWDEEILEQFLKGPARGMVALHDSKGLSGFNASTSGKTITGAASLGKDQYGGGLANSGNTKWKHLQPTIAPTHGLWLWNSEYEDVPNREVFENTDSGVIG